MKRIGAVLICLIALTAVVSAQEDEGGLVPLEHGDAAAVRSMLLGGSLPLPDGLDDIELLPVQNALRLWGTDAAVAEVQEILAMVDVPRKRVRITLRKLATDDPAALLDELVAASDRPADAPLYILEPHVIGGLVDDGLARVVADRALEIANGEAAMFVPMSTALEVSSSDLARDVGETPPTFECRVIPQINPDDTVKLWIHIDEALGAWQFGERPLEVVVRLESGKAVVLAQRDDAGDLFRPIYVVGAEILQPAVQVNVRQVTGDDEQLIVERLFPDGLEPATSGTAWTLSPEPEEVAGVRQGTVDEDAVDHLLDQGMITISHGPGVLVTSGDSRTLIAWEDRAQPADGQMVVDRVAVVNGQRQVVYRPATLRQPAVYETLSVGANRDGSVGLSLVLDDLQLRYAGVSPLDAGLHLRPGETVGIVDLDEHGALRRPICLVNVGLVDARW